MDANGLRFWMLAGEADWDIDAASGASYDGARGALTLASRRSVAVDEDPGRAEGLLAAVPQTVDGLGTFAYYDEDARAVLAAGAAPGTETLFALGPGDSLTDLALGHDGVLYAAVNGGVRAHDLRQRWPAFTTTQGGLTAFRLAPQPRGGALILDRAGRRIWRLSGLPFPELGQREFEADVFRPRPENPTPPRLELVASGAPVLDPVALATSSSGATLLLSWGAAGEAYVQQLDGEGRLGSPRRLRDVARPFSLGWLEAGRFAVLTARTSGAEVVPYTWNDATPVLLPDGGVYPLAHHHVGPFAHALTEPARYPTRPAADAPSEHPRPLVRLSAPELAVRGQARNLEPFDGGRAHFVWHRLYLEAVLPRGCGVQVGLAATETRKRPPDSVFVPHVFGDVAAPAGTPRGVWSTYPSELPYHPGLLACAPEADRSGLFGVLVQRTGRAVSALAGRYLWIRIELAGNGRTAPEIAAVRAYGSRFSYVQKYLPRFYQEQLLPPDADAVSARTTPADFLERMLLNFEGILTPLEDRIAHAHLLTNPQTTPEEALDWLGQWVGFTFDPAYPPASQRRALASVAELQRFRGTLRGLSLALDIVTDDARARGEVIVVEDFRLRRTFATILGADLADEDDPLLGGLVRSGNSYVGDSLILSREFRYEFVAVFRSSLPEPPRGFSLDQWVDYVFQRLVGSALIDDFFGELANRVTVLVRQETTSDRVRLIERVLELDAPAHVQTQLVRASHPFIVGLASLVGVDTFLREAVPPPALRIDQSELGRQAFLRSHASLDPRLEGRSS
jgi:phage tail-like protein